MRRNIISLSLSDELADMMLEHWIDGGYASASEYIRELIRNDLRQRAENPQRFRIPRGRFRDDQLRKPGR
jgi:Arc/MetJ-type ribon-helix-helix transcriptional regulator